MVLPITRPAPSTTIYGGDSAGSCYRYRAKSKQAKPYNLPLEYSFIDVRCTSATMFGLPPWATYGGLATASAIKGFGLCGPDIGVAYPGFSGDVDALTNTVRAKLVSKLGEGAMLAVNYAERQQSLDMMKARLLQLADFTKALRRKDFRSAAKALNLDPSSSRVRKISDRYRNVRSMSRAWLEFHFGWEPLVKDIYSGVEILQSPVKSSTKLKVSASRPFGDSYSQYVPNGTTWVKYERVISGDIKVKAGATFRVTNQDAWLANRLGLTNPIGIAYELIPFSFMVDWFSTLGDFLNQWTDFVGLSVEDSWYSYECKCPISTYREYGVRINEVYKPQPFDKSIHLKGVYMRRFRGLPGVTLAIRRPKRASVTRTATALSLLLQRMPKG